MTLYEIDERILDALDRAIDMETGEIIDETMAELLNELEMEREIKIENIALYIKDLLAEAEAIKAEKMKLAARQAAAEKKADRLKKYLSDRLDGDKFKTSRVSISYRRSEKLYIEDVSKVPEDYLRYKDPEPDMQSLKKAIHAGQTFDGIEIIEHRNIQVA